MRTRRHAVPRPLRWSVGLALAFLLLPLLQLMPAAAAPDETGTALAAINQARAAIGVPPLTRNGALDQAATAHASYYRLNYGDPTLAGMGLHTEAPGKPGFTGADMAARAKAAGYSGTVNENIGLSGSMLISLDWFMGTVNHRLPLLDPRYTDIGFGVVNDGKAKMEVIDLGTVIWRATITPTWEPWPPPGAKEIGARFEGESPNPFPGATYPLGYPITLKYNGPGSVTFAKASLTLNGQTIPTIGAPGTTFAARNAYGVAATAPLLPGSLYTIAIEGTANNQPFNQSWSFTTKGTPPAAPSPPSPTPATNLPPGVAAMDPAAIARWRAADEEVYRRAVARTWTWGPDVLAARQEEYDDVPGQTRTVYYFDKSRMEISNPNGDRTSPWFITNGLLVREMIAGQLQLGDTTFETRAPAAITVAGDPAARNPTCVTYAALATVASLAPGQNSVPQRTGQSIVETIDAAGTVGRNPGLAGTAGYGAYDATLGHNIADVFWRWLQAQPVDWVYATGYPLTEPYWTLTKINGVETWVLVQAFERRILTFNPANPSGWQVEAGNVGRHYYEWRYGAPPP